MSHRLFHTLVLSSAVLLEACGGSSATSESSSSSGTSSNDTSGSEETSSDTSNTQVATLNAEMQAAVRDARACEEGWPTTKGARYVSDATSSYACSTLGSETMVCCVSGPAPTP